MMYDIVLRIAVRKTAGTEMPIPRDISIEVEANNQIEAVQAFEERLQRMFYDMECR